MYEHMTYEVILQRMLDRVSNQHDKREGSVIYDALAPAAVELQLMYIEFDIILKETFGDTASREYLIRRARERGIIPYPATYALVKGEFTPSAINIPIGSRFSVNDLNYYVKEKIENGVYQLECETIGIEGNQDFGDLIPIEYINGLVTAQLTELLIPGEDEEGTESLRIRYFDSFDAKAYGGNKSDYLQKTNSIAGVGSTKVTPIWNGGGTVKLTILDSDFDKATTTLIDTVQEEIDPTNSPGEGLGVAPIGHVVTVDTATEVTIDITASITFDTDYSWEMLESDVLAAMEAYMLELRTDWASQGILIVRISQIETRILAIEGIIDISDTLINSLGENLELDQYEIPVLGTVVNS